MLNYINKLHVVNIEKLFIIVFLFIVFSYEFHVLWLLYDFLAVFSMFYFSNKMKKNLLILTAVVLSYLVFLLAMSGFHVISFLSIWDNIKHLFVFFAIFTLIDKYKYTRSLTFINTMGKILTPLFIIEVLVVFYQYFNGYHFDDISGTFGYGASHAVGYFSLLYIAYLIYAKHTQSYILVLALLFSILINYMSENMGFYILLTMILGFYNLKVFFLAILSMLMIFLFSFPTSLDFAWGIYNRYSDFFNLTQELDYNNIRSTRSALLVYAWSLGELFGAGPGSFSEIYGFTGWRFSELVNRQIHISSVTGLLAEYGLIGLSFWITIYIYYIAYFFQDIKTKLFVSIFFTTGMFYNRALMDERIIFMLILLFVFVKMRHITKRGIE